MADTIDNNLDKIQQLSQGLAALPPASVALSKRQTIARLAGDIQRARDNGYTLKQIAEHLNRAGLDIRYDALRSLLPRQNKARRRKPTPRVATGDTVRRREVAALTTAGIRILLSQPCPTRIRLKDPQTPQDGGARTALGRR